MRPRFAHVRDLLRSHKTIKDLLDHRQRELELIAAVRGHLPESVRAHCLDIGLVEERLVIFLDSPTWATRARFLADDILNSLSHLGVREIRVQVRLNDKNGPAFQQGKAGPRHRLTAGAQIHLLEAADHMHDPELREAFRRFALRRAPSDPGED
jgi:hypothetical protein